ncbi:MAG: hypothetical protein AAFY78_01535 [Cyanobacteria bacterium J06648_16]
MEQLKLALGPYALFAAIVGGVPLLLGCLSLYNPMASLQEFVPLIQANVSAAIALTMLLISYVLGSTFSGLTWRYFLRLCALFRQDYRYFGNLLVERRKSLNLAAIKLSELDFEDRLVALLSQKIGLPEKSSWLDARLMVYLRSHNPAGLITAESYQATHIMYRNLSFGLVWIALIWLINIFRVSALTLEQFLVLLAALGLAYATFTRAVTFKHWHNREILLGFYFTVDRSTEGPSSSVVNR